MLFRPWLLLPLLGLSLFAFIIARSRSVGEEKKAPEAMAMFGGSVARNMANTVDKGIPAEFVVRPKGSEKNVKWQTQLGSYSYGGPVVAGGRIFVGTNNDSARDKKNRGDKGVVMCFSEKDGKFLWQIVHERIDPVNDADRQGVISTPCVEGDRLYYVSNSAILVCADVKGDEKTQKGKILWQYDMIKELDVYPSQASACSPLVVGDLIFVVTGNGVDHKGDLPKPKAPSFIAVNKKTGKLAWKSDLPGKNIISGQWSNAAAATVNGKTQILFPGGDGWMYGLEAKTGELIWKFDCNPKKATAYKSGGGSEQCFIVATPVVYDNKCYIAVGQDPDSDGPGVGHLWCIDIAKKPANKDKDLSPVNDNFDPKAAVNKDSGLVWHHGGKVVPVPKDDSREFHFGRTIGTVAIHDGIVYASELAGYMQALDAKTGKKLWEHDFTETTWCSPYYVDGKVYLGTDTGNLYVFTAGRKHNAPKKISCGQPLRTPPLAANGVLYVNAKTMLYAIEAKK